MANSIPDIKKRRGRPRTTGTGTMIALRLHDPLLGALDSFRAEEAKPTSRPEAVRLLLADSLKGLRYLPKEGKGK